MTLCYLGLGSNLRPRRKNIESAIGKIKELKGTKVIKVARLIETSPVGGPRHQGKFLNTCLKINTSLSPSSLLNNLKNIERQLGRTRTVRFGPRTIDLDILFYGARVIKRKGLEIPHPRAWKRDFVLRPLSELIA